MDEARNLDGKTPERESWHCPVLTEISVEDVTKGSFFTTPDGAPFTTS